MTPDTAAWTAISRSWNADFFDVEPGVLAVVPFDGSSDTAETATDSLTRMFGTLEEALTWIWQTPKTR